MGYRGDCCDRLPNAVLTLLMLLLFEVLCWLKTLIVLTVESREEMGAGAPSCLWLPVCSPGLWCWGTKAQLGQHHTVVPAARVPNPVPTECRGFCRGQESAKVIYNEFSNSKGNSSIWGLAQWAESAGQLLGIGTGTCSLQFHSARFSSTA